QEPFLALVHQHRGLGLAPAPVAQRPGQTEGHPDPIITPAHFDKGVGGVVIEPDAPTSIKARKRPGAYRESRRSGRPTLTLTTRPPVVARHEGTHLAHGVHYCRAPQIARELVVTPVEIRIANRWPLRGWMN